MFQFKCKKARVQKWLEETDKQRQRCRQEKTTAKRVKEGKEQQKDKNIAPREEEADFIHHPGRDRGGTIGEEQQIREEFRGSPHQSKEKTTETIGASEGRERDNEKQPRKAGAARETTAGAGAQDTVGDLEVGGMKHGDLEGCRGIIEEVEDGKALLLLVGGERRVRVNKQKLRTDVEVEPVEVLPPDFAEVGLQAQLGVSAAATKEEVKASYKKMVLKLHPHQNKNNQEKATELFKWLNSAYENWRSNGTPAGQGGNNQSAPYPHHTNFQFNPTYFRSNFCGQNEPHKETPQQA